MKQSRTKVFRFITLSRKDRVTRLASAPPKYFPKLVRVRFPHGSCSSSMQINCEMYLVRYIYKLQSFDIPTCELKSDGLRSERGWLTEFN